MDRRVVTGRRVLAEEGGEDILNSAVEKILAGRTIAVGRVWGSTINLKMYMQTGKTTAKIYNIQTLLMRILSHRIFRQPEVAAEKYEN